MNETCAQSVCFAFLVYSISLGEIIGSVDAVIVWNVEIVSFVKGVSDSLFISPIKFVS